MHLREIILNVECDSTEVQPKAQVYSVRGVQGIKPTTRPAIEINYIGLISEEVFMFLTSLTQVSTRRLFVDRLKQSLLISQNYREWFFVILKSHIVYLNLESNQVLN